ncbi:exonuclease domain-containing protein [Ideonella sp. A 288]|uniref:exonuclease domain-containing protein n=1 Tax=Ideonella sp. A 288 TaxID=1962181 RepID=UPI000B4A9012|nr:exonuclease domain-containing protein [Ideonella sp. A 288]
MKVDKLEVAATLAPGLALGLVLLAAGGVLAGTLEPPERAALGAMVEPRGALLVLVWLAASAAAGALARRAYGLWVAAPARMAEAAQAVAAGAAAHALAPAGGAGLQALAGVVNDLVRQREGYRADIDAKVREAARGIEQERSRLAALMSELTQSVVVCNLDGRILLYNNRARVQFRALSNAPALADGAELIGLGRSVYTVFDRKLVAHALESIQQRLLRGAAQPSAQFVTASRAGQLLRVQMAPVRDPSAATDEPARLSGFVLMLENITRDFEDDSAQDRLLLGLTEGSRSSLGNLQAAVDMLELPDLEPPMRERFLGVVRDEVRAMTTRIQDLATSTSQGLKTRWPLEEMLGADLVQAALRRIETQLGVRTAAVDVDPSVWLKVDSFALLQALGSLAARLVEEFEIKMVQMRLRRDGERAHLDLIWTGHNMSTETVMSWESSPMTVGPEISPLSVRDVVERHGAEFWFQRERVRHEAYFRFLLPLATPQEQFDSTLLLKSDSRPEYYDFDLFRANEQTRELDDRRLVELAYTVFDTETTGLDPSSGDEILQIGAARIVNGKLLRQESFEQLVDPCRDIPAAGIPIHGITPDMVAGKPPIGQVLPAFHAFASDTVLVAHNAAFDMRFLQLKEEATGLRFDQPVLDTLLLSAVVHPHQESHQLETIAERFGITVIGRHTALGDAIVTAEVFLKLVPLLADKGIHTLGQAREAAQQTFYARLKY